MADFIGQSLGRYHILEQLGEGGMAIVYKAFDTRLERDVAVKVIRTERLTIETMPKALKRFEREAKALAKLTHPNIVPISDYGEHEAKPYLVMPYLPGGTLKQKLGQPIPWQEAVQLLIPIAEALDYAHSQNMVHRDVKPSNVLLTQRGQPMLTDFGIARILDVEETMDLTGSAAMGTPEYMAPEQVTAKTADHRADIYALGVVLYEMVTGRRPFVADTPMAVLIKQATEALPRPTSLLPSLPDAVEKVLLKSLAKNPADRYQTMADMAIAFEKLLEGAEKRSHLGRQDEPSVSKAAPQPEPVSAPQKSEEQAARRTTRVEQKPHVEAPPPSAEKAQNEAVVPVKAAAQPAVPTPKPSRWTWIPFAAGGAVLILLVVCGLAAFSYLRGMLAASPPATEEPIPTEARATAAPSPTLPPTEPPAVEVTATEPPAVEIQHGTLRVGMYGGPDTLDPPLISFVPEFAYISKIYEGLTKLNADLETVPAAAESWTYSSDATVLTFTLRPGLTYSDGTLLNAERFAYSIKRNIDPATGGFYASITDEIQGAPEWRGGNQSARSIVDESVKASHADGSPCSGYDDEDCNTLTLTFSRPASYFHTVMSLGVIAPAKEENIEAGGGSWWSSPEYQIGNGPWILESFEQGTGARFRSNPNYWAGEPNYDIEYSQPSDGPTAIASYKAGDLDIIPINPEDWSTVESDPILKQEPLIYPGACTYAALFNQSRAPFDDQAVREAFSYALDREAWASEVLVGFGSPTLTWIPPGFPGYQADESRFNYDPDRAREVLADAGYTVDNGRLMKNGRAVEIVATFTDTPRNQTRHGWLAAQWKEVLGIDVSLNPVDAATLGSSLGDSATAPQINVRGWCADYPDPQNWLSAYWKTGNFGAPFGYSNAEFDMMVNQADMETDPRQRAALYAQAQDILIGDAPAAFLWNNVNAYLVKPWVKGINRTPMDNGYPGDADPLSIYIDVSMLP